MAIAAALLGIVLIALGILFLYRPEAYVGRLVQTGTFTEEKARRVVRVRAWGGIVLGAAGLLIVALDAINS